MGKPNPTFRAGTRQRMTSDSAGDLREVVPACPPAAYLQPKADPLIADWVKAEDAKVLDAINKAIEPSDESSEQATDGYPIVRPAQE